MCIYHESDTSCKHKHTCMLENGASPDKFDILYCVLHIEFHGFNSRIDDLGLSHFGSWY